jgi:hypothetical protein
VAEEEAVAAEPEAGAENELEIKAEAEELFEEGEAVSA